MPSNRRRHANPISMLVIATWIIIAAFFCGAGLYYVYCKNQLHIAGEETAKLGHQLKGLETEIEVARVNIQRLSSHTAIEAKLKGTAFAGLIPIPEGARIRITDATPRTTDGGGELRPVTNERTQP